MKPVGICYLIHQLEMGGTETHLVEVVRHLDRRRFAPVVCCLREPGRLGKHVEAMGVPVLGLGIERIYGRKAYRMADAFAAFLRHHHVRILHNYLVSANIYGTLVGRLARVPRIVTSRRDMGFSRNWRLGLVERCLVNRRVDRIVVVCDAVRQRAAREMGAGPAKVTTIPNGIDTETWVPRPPDPALQERWGIAPGDQVVGIVGVLTPVKGHRYFLEAAMRIAWDRPGVKFLVVGDGTERKDCERLARELAIGDRVIFAGSQDETAPFLTLMDVVVCSSLSEGMSMSLLEAMAMGKPVVATRVGGNPEVVADGVTGLLVPARDGLVLAKAIQRLLDDPLAAAYMGQAGRARAESEFTLRGMVRRMEELYAGLLRDAGAPPVLAGTAKTAARVPGARA
ncbi:MAG TPA: glycosyltransferase [Candidatus Methylomirabilis sp.]|jgi:glycosyltransferase involved in cell wall biosynthesis